MARMDLIAGVAEEILLVVASGERGSLVDGDRVSAHLQLGAGMDPTWLDMFSEAARAIADDDDPVDLLDARIELDVRVAGDDGSLIVERVHPTWVTAIARLPDSTIDALTGRWIDRLEEELGHLPAEEKPWIRELADRIVRFCRVADRAPDVVFVWSLR